MNSIYLKAGELGHFIPSDDRRFQHLTKILKKKQGEYVNACCSDGTQGRALIASLDKSGIVLAYEPAGPASELRPLRLILGFPRPIQAGRILKDLTTLGVGSIWFVLTDTSEKSYAESDFFQKKDFEFHLIEGAEQAGNPRFPLVRTFWSLDKACVELNQEESNLANYCGSQTGTPKAMPEPYAGERRLALHLDKQATQLMHVPLSSPVTIAIGSERGWSERELAVLREQGFLLCSLGDRILKTETAAIAAASIVLARLGCM
ncbi:MAG: 16S rRNA (uracil(1498)-N(3))-methyltransferase [Spirochaetaceae bacterium]|nr:16S rRNA (uracil(1498)-N(3))-methyltransferase [Spirochaetaceae bacterium]